MALIIVEGQATQVVVGEPIVLKRGNLVLTGSLPVALGETKVVGVGLSTDKPLERLGVGILSNSGYVTGQSPDTPNDLKVSFK